MSDEAIRVLLVDDQRLLREGLRTLLELEADLRVVGEAEDGEAALTAYETLTPDIVLMDVRMPGMDGVAARRALRARRPDARVLILTTFDEDRLVFEGLRAGARGYLLKAASGAEIADAIRAVVEGGAVIEPGVARRVVDAFAREGAARPEARPPEEGLEPLSDREREVLRLLAAGRKNREIAEQLHLAEGTVKNYVSAILQKLGARDRTEAALLARERGLA